MEQFKRETGVYPQGLELIAAVIERARFDNDYSKEDCPVGNHKVYECAASLIFEIDRYAAQNNADDAAEYALEFFHIAGEVDGG